LVWLPDGVVLRERIESSERLKLLSAHVVAIREIQHSGDQPREENGQETQSHQKWLQSHISQKLPKIQEEITEIAD
jgi:hypothetical protein